MRNSIEKLRTDYETAHAVLSKAEDAGMEVSQPLFDLNGAKTALVKARASIHGFNLNGVNAEVKPGLRNQRKSARPGDKGARRTSVSTQRIGGFSSGHSRFGRWTDPENTPDGKKAVRGAMRRFKPFKTFKKFKSLGIRLSALACMYKPKRGTR